MKANTEWLDTIGAYARSVDDIALFRAALMAIPYRPIAQARHAAAHRRLLHAITRTSCSRRHRGGRTTRRRSSPRRARRCSEIDLPPPVRDMTEGQQTLSAFDGPRAACRRGAALPRPAEREPARTTSSRPARRSTTRPGSRPASWARRGRAAVDALFADIDVILTAPAPGEAPLGLERTGNATFNLLWTYLWMPCVTLPFTQGPAGLPVGIQLVGRQHEDAALLDMAAWVRGALQ